MLISIMFFEDRVGCYLYQMSLLACFHCDELWILFYQKIYDNFQIKRGYLCAVFFEDDNRWYRAKVCVVSKNNQNVLDTLVDLYLLDFGESIYEKVGNLRAIPSEFLNLNFQAIECGLSNVKSM